MPRVSAFLCLVFPLANLLCPAASHGQPREQPVPGYVMKRWSTAEGLPHNNITAVLQTRDGYLWIGTGNAGLVRFDGLTFKTFNLLNSPGLPSDLIDCLYEDAEGTLWVGTDVGLARYRDGVFTSERVGEDVPHNVVIDIGGDRDGHLWVATPEGIVRRDGDRWSAVPSGTGQVYCFWLSADGAVWIGTSAGLLEWRNLIVRTITIRDGLPSNSVTALREDRDGRLWIGTDNGLAHLDRQRQQLTVERGSLSGAPISGLFVDTRGVVWIGSTGRLFTRTPEGALSESKLVNAGEAEPGRATVFTEDREGQIWFGVQGGLGGVHRLGPMRVNILDHEQGLPCDNIGPLTEAPDGTVWLATLCRDGRGVAAIRDGRVAVYSGPAYIESLLAESDGTVWVGTFYGHLYRFHDGRFIELPSPTRDVPTGIAVIHRDHHGSLWLGTGHGLFALRDGAWTRLQVADGLVNDDVRMIVSDRDGALWIGTADGISRYHAGRFTNYGVAEDVPRGPVRAIHIDTQGVLWIGTYGGGLARSRGTRFVAFGEQGGVLDSSVHRIIAEGEDHLWLSGDRGIRRVAKRDLNGLADGRVVAPDVTLYNEADGMPSAECNGMAQPAGWRMRDGTFQFPTQRGLVRIDPALAARSAPPRPHIENVRLDGVSLTGAAVVISAGYRDLEFQYTAPSLARPELVQFRSRLEGYHADWIDVGTRRLATFTNLRPGRYRFLVAARTGGGDWSEEPAVVAFVVEPSVYQRPWFQLALVALAFGASMAVGQWYVASLRRRARQLEDAVAERTADLSVAHQRLSSAHESLMQAKREVEQAHGQVLAVFNQLEIGVLVLNERGVVRYASASAQRLLRKDEPELVGQSWSACLPLIEADREQLERRIERVTRSEGRVELQMIVAGKRYWMEIDVRDEPWSGAGRVLYIYSVTEIATSPGTQRSDGPHGLVGRSTAMHVLYKQIRDVARVDSTVLIQGETGVGKELVARAIHLSSARAQKPFVAINAAGLSESLLATQLFGHRRGAFTGAVEDHEGVFEAAKGGTVFLDEIGDMPASLQATLLRVLQEREIMRVGESQPRLVDVRFLAATHRDLAREVRDGRFREDLLYRIRVAAIRVPPLRERIEDVPALVDAFLAEAAAQFDQPKPFVSRDAIDALMRYRWPGNVRELESVVDQALVKTSGPVIRVYDLAPEIVGSIEPDAANAIAEAQSERDRLVEALRLAKGNRAKAARLLGIGRTTLYKRLAEYGLDHPSDSDA